MAWHLTGELTETCNCNTFCPCWYAVAEQMVFDQERCTGALTLHIRQGDADGIDLSGRTAVVAFDFPGPTLFDGNGIARLYLDDGADAAARGALEAIMTGKRGGPMEILGGLMGEWKPTLVARIERTQDGDAVAVAVGDVGRVRQQVMRDAGGQNFTLRGGGFVAGLGLAEAELAPSSATRWSDPDFRRFDAKSGARGTFTWRG